MAETDIKVILDPKPVGSPVIKALYGVNEYNESKDYTGIGVNNNVLTEYGIKSPIIKINNRVVELKYIDYFRISSHDFMPTVSLCIKDTNSIVQNTDRPGLNNVISIIITPILDGAYKSIKMDFYIIDARFYDGNYITYDGVFKFLPYETNIFKSFKPQKTFDFLKEICSEIGIGFAASNKCEDIEDKHLRFVQQLKYKDVIPQHIRFGGIDEHSIFDTWTDFYGYVNMINLAYIFETKIDPNSLKIKSVIGGYIDNPNFLSGNLIKEVPRTITNLNNVEFTDLSIEKYEVNVNTKDIFEHGTQSNYQLLTLKDVLPEYDNDVVTKLHKTVEHSWDGMHFDDYKFVKYDWIGCEFDEISILNQQFLHDKTLMKYKYDHMIVTMRLPNFGLTRGMCINVVIADSLQNLKASTVLHGVGVANNTGSETQDTSIVKTDSPQTLQVFEKIMSNRDSVIDMGVSGVYYIDGLEFEYISPNLLVQKLFLIKHGDRSHTLNKYTYPNNVK